MLYGMFFAMSFALIRGYHDPPFAAGLRLTVIPVALGLVAPFGGTFADKRPRLVMAAGMAVCLASALALTALLTGTPQSLIGVMAALAAYGVGLGLYIAPNNSATIGAAPADKSGVAGGLLNLLRVFGAGVGVGCGLDGAGLGAANGDRRWRAHNPCARGRAALGGRRRAVDARDFRGFGRGGGAHSRQIETSDRQARTPRPWRRCADESAMTGREPRPDRGKPDG